MDKVVTEMAQRGERKLESSKRLDFSLYILFII